MKEAIAKRREEKPSFRLEVCCGSYEDAYTALAAGADRIELNSALPLGGLTPSIEALQMIKEAFPSANVAVMNRPRGGGFCYTEAEYAQMKRALKPFAETGADGIVFGFLHADHSIDRERTKALCDEIHALGMEAVFHRAIDVVTDIEQGIEILIALGIDRVLTSGGQRTAIEGCSVIRHLQATYGDRIQILAGCGVNPDNVRQLVMETGVTQVHSSCKGQKEDPTTIGDVVSYEIYPGLCTYDAVMGEVITEMRGCMKEKTGLVLEGGGVRGAYTAGALRWLAEQGIHFDYGVGISTGAAYLAMHVSNETETAKAMSTGFAVDSQNVGLKPLLTCGHFVDADRIFNHYLKEMRGFCAKPVRESEAYMEIGVYDLEKGKTVYYSNRDLDDDLDLIRAAISLPIASEPVVFKGRKLLDGGITKMIPIERAIEQGCKKCLIITTKPTDFVRKPASRFIKLLMRIAYRKYPSVLRDYEIRHLNYFKQMDLIKSLVASGEAIQVGPSAQIQVNRFKGDSEKCKKIYEMGYQDMEARKQEILDFLQIR